MKEHPILFSGPMLRAIPTKMREWNESRKIVLNNNYVKSLFYEGKTAVEISVLLGCSTYPVKRTLKQLGLKRPANRRPGKGVGPDNSSWKGGRRIRPDGYVIVWTPNGERLEHQVVMERHTGRQLLKGEVIHHLDGNKQNNCPENLYLTTQNEHIQRHMPEIQSGRFKK